MCTKPNRRAVELIDSAQQLIADGNYRLAESRLQDAKAQGAVFASRIDGMTIGQRYRWVSHLLQTQNQNNG